MPRPASRCDTSELQPCRRAARTARLHMDEACYRGWKRARPLLSPPSSRNTVILPSPCNACSQSKHRFLEPALGRAAARGWQPTSSGTLLAAVIPCWPRVREQKAPPALSVWSGAGLSLAHKATSQAHVSTAAIASSPPGASVFQGKTLVPNHPQTSGRASCCPIVSPWALEAAFFTLCFQMGVPGCLPLPECPTCSIWGWDYCRAPSASQAVGLAVCGTALAKDATAKQEIG